MTITQPILIALRIYLRWSPWRRGAGPFLRALSVCDRVGFEKPVVKTEEGDLLYFHGKEVLLIDILTKGTFEHEGTCALRRVTPRGGVFIDIGANIGYYTIQSARWVGGTGHVFAFEPIPTTRGLLEQNIALNNQRNITVLPIACSSRNGHARMITGRDSGWSRLVPNDKGDTEVEICTLDRVVQDLGIKRMDVLKIDVEGSDFEVIRGAKRAISIFRPVVMLEVEHTENYGTSINEIEEFFRSLRYSSRILDDGNSRDMLCIPS